MSSLESSIENWNGQIILWSTPVVPTQDMEQQGDNAYFDMVLIRDTEGKLRDAKLRLRQLKANIINARSQIDHWVQQITQSQQRLDDAQPPQAHVIPSLTSVVARPELSAAAVISLPDLDDPVPPIVLDEDVDLTMECPCPTPINYSTNFDWSKRMKECLRKTFGIRQFRACQKRFVALSCQGMEAV
jgi:hypothetical protein